MPRPASIVSELPFIDLGIIRRCIGGLSIGAFLPIVLGAWEADDGGLPCIREVSET
jgi:hypothetical protein